VPARRREVHWYAVYVSMYADEATKAGIERFEEDFLVSGPILAEVFYNSTSRAQAERAFVRACLFAVNTPLAFEVVMQRDDQTLLRVKAEHLRANLP
jgi:hypothetical protein